MLYIRGINGTALVRIAMLRSSDVLQATVLNDGAKLTIRRDSDANFLTDLRALEAHIGVITGAPTIVSDLSELV